MKGFTAFLLLMSSVSTYFSAESKILFYSVFVLLLLFYLFQIKFKVNNQLFYLIPVSYFLISVTSLLINFDLVDNDVFQSLLYPIILLLVILGGYKIVFDLKESYSKILILFFFLNGLVAFLSILGVLSNIPIFGEINRGRYIFGTNIQSSSGLIWNVNYYSITQLLGFWLSFFCYKYYKLDKIWLLLICFIAASTVLGSSRSITVTFIISYLVYFYFLSGNLIKYLIKIIACIFLFLMGSFYAYLAQDEQLRTAFRLDRGLNGRDELWKYGFELFLESPLFGVFSIKRISDYLTEDIGLHNSTVQNTFLFTLIRLGVFGAGLLLLFVICVFYKFLRMEKNAVNVIVFCIFLSIVIDSMVRSYSLGGVGFSPFLLMVSGSLIILHKNISTGSR